MIRITWIRVAVDLPEHPKSKLLEELLGEPNAWAYPVRLWMWCSNYADEGRIPGRMVAVAERAAGWKGEPLRLLNAMVDVGFLEQDGDGFITHDWDENQGAAIRKAHKDAERKRQRYEEAKAEAIRAREVAESRERRAREVVTTPARGARVARVPDLTGRDVTGPDELPSSSTARQDAWAAFATEERLKAHPNAIPEVLRPEKVAEVLKAADLAKVSDERLKAGYRAFLQDAWAQKTPRVPCPWAAWASKWSEYVPGQAPTPSQPVRRMLGGPPLTAEECKRLDAEAKQPGLAGQPPPNWEDSTFWREVMAIRAKGAA